MTRKTTTREKLLLLVLSPLLLLLLALLIVGLPFYGAYRILLRLAFEALVGIKGRRILLVYSRSPRWQEYVENHWLTQIRDHAMVLNWSDRATWKAHRSFAVWVFRHWAPSRNFNPMAIVFPRFQRARRIGFYHAFRDLEHGKEGPLRDAETQLFAWLGQLRRPNA